MLKEQRVRFSDESIGQSQESANQLFFMPESNSSSGGGPYQGTSRNSPAGSDGKGKSCLSPLPFKPLAQAKSAQKLTHVARRITP